ncbi:MAG TPA: hypothetical protein PLX89_26535, partial [Verrucomicrobiota bacterium]|nr:hypothetical protein [Verrucomicrobiota bacterium]
QISVLGGTVVFAGTGGSPGAPYAILTATNIEEPLIEWLSLVTNLFGPTGGFSFTNDFGTNETQRFFRLRTP